MVNKRKEEVFVYRIQPLHSMHVRFTTDPDKAEKASKKGCIVTAKKEFRWRKDL